MRKLFLFFGPALSLLLPLLLASAAHAEMATLKLGLPIACAIGKDCWVQQYPDHDPSGGVADYACGTQTYDGHDGTDIRIRDTAAAADVIAAAAGTVKAVRDGVTDHLMLTPEDRKAVGNKECGNGVLLVHGDGWETQYCHMRRGSVSVKAGDKVTAGTRLGEAGYSGMAAFPHVHLTVRKDGKSLDPFAMTGDQEKCGVGRTALWTDEALAALTYAKGSLLRTGFAPGGVEIGALETGEQKDAAFADDWPALVAYGWAINLSKGDAVTVTLTGPEGISAENSVTLDRAKAQYLLFAGQKRPAPGWPKGDYEGTVEIRNGPDIKLTATWIRRLN